VRAAAAVVAAADAAAAAAATTTTTTTALSLSPLSLSLFPLSSPSLAHNVTTTTTTTTTATTTIHSKPHKALYRPVILLDRPRIGVSEVSLKPLKASHRHA
jgi:hypothetical protein